MLAVGRVSLPWPRVLSGRQSTLLLNIDKMVLYIYTQNGTNYRQLLLNRDKMVLNIDKMLLNIDKMVLNMCYLQAHQRVATGDDQVMLEELDKVNPMS